MWQWVLGWLSTADGDIESLRPETIKPLSRDAIDADLDRLCDVVQRKAYAAIDWYVAARRSKKRAAWWVRLGAILFVSLAGLVPVLDAAGLIGVEPTVIAVVADGDPASIEFRQVQETVEEARSRFAALELGQLGYVFAALAAALVGLDRFLGLSTGWVRYITAELSLRKALADFQMDWMVINAELADDAGEQRCPRKCLALIKDFSARIDEYVEAETRQWAAEFQGALAMLQTAVREAQEAARPGTVRVTVQRGAGIRAGATVYLDGEARGRTSNGTLTLPWVGAGGTRWRRSGSARTGARSAPRRPLRCRRAGWCPSHSSWSDRGPGTRVLNRRVSSRTVGPGSGPSAARSLVGGATAALPQNRRAFVDFASLSA